MHLTIYTAKDQLPFSPLHSQSVVHSNEWASLAKISRLYISEYFSFKDHLLQRFDAPAAQLTGTCSPCSSTRPRGFRSFADTRSQDSIQCNIFVNLQLGAPEQSL